MKRVKLQEDRVTDAYINEAMELDRYKVEMENLRVRRQELDRMAGDLERRARHEADSRAALKHLEQFCNRVSVGLDALTFDERQQLLRLVIESITVEDGRVRIEAIIPQGDQGVELRTRRQGERANHDPCARGLIQPSTSAYLGRRVDESSFL